MDCGGKAGHHVGRHDQDHQAAHQHPPAHQGHDEWPEPFRPHIVDEHDARAAGDADKAQQQERREALSELPTAATSIALSASIAGAVTSATMPINRLRQIVSVGIAVSHRGPAARLGQRPNDPIARRRAMCGS